MFEESLGALFSMNGGGLTIGDVLKELNEIEKSIDNGDEEAPSERRLEEVVETEVKTEKKEKSTNPEMPKVGLVGKMIKYACYGLLLLIVAFVCKNYVFSLFNDDGQFVPKLVELKANDPSKLK